MLTKTEILKTLKRYKESKAESYGIEEIGLFGSAARDELHPDSDIDIFVKLKRPSFFNMMTIQEDLEKIYGCKVDVISLGAIMRPIFKKNLEKDAVYIQRRAAGDA